MKRESAGADRRGVEVGGGHPRGHVGAAVVHGATGQTLLAEEDRRPGRRRTRDGLAFVERHLPAGRQVIGGQGQLVDIGDLFHRLTDHQAIAAITHAEGAFGQQHVLARERRAVDAGLLEEPDAAHAEDVGDKARGRAVEGKEHRTTGELPLRLFDHLQASAVEMQFRLQDAVRPHERHEIGARGAAETDRHRLQALAGPRLRAGAVERCPARPAAHRDPGADARHVRTPLVARLRTSGRGEGRIGVAARAGRPGNESRRGDADNRRAAGDIKGRHRPRRRVRAAIGDRRRLTGRGHRIGLPRPRGGDHQLEAAVPVDVRDRELGALGRVAHERRQERRPHHAAVIP